MKLIDIIGNKKRGIVGVFPVSHATWFNGQKDGRHPLPIKIGKSTFYKVEDVKKLIGQ
jgi:prophage regulatory protein